MNRSALLGLSAALAMTAFGLLAAPGEAHASGPCTKNNVGWRCTVRTPDGSTLGNGGGYPNGGGPSPGTVVGSVGRAGAGPGGGVQYTGKWVWLDHTPNPASGHFSGPVGRHQNQTQQVPMGGDYWRACTGGPRFTCTPWFK